MSKDVILSAPFRPEVARAGRFFGRCLWLVLGWNAPALASPLAAAEEFLACDVISRHFQAPAIGGDRYVVLVTGPAKEVHAAKPVELPEAELKKLVHQTLQSQGFAPAAKSDEASVAIAIAYGRGEYEPPYSFMGVDPAFHPRWMWPGVLKAYDESFRRLDYSDADVTGFPLKREPTTAQLYNVVIVRAFDARDLRQERRWTLCWETRITINATAGSLEHLLPSMLAAARGRLGSEARQGAVVRLPTKRPEVRIGDPKVIE